MKKTKKTIPTKFGFKQIDPMPNKDELQDYYSSQYYQNPHGTFQQAYSEDEITHRNLRIDLIYHGVLANFDKQISTRPQFLDIGCGEGFLLKHFKSHGWEILGLDFSIEGIKRQNADLSEHVIQGDIYHELENLLYQNSKFEVIYLGNILEHVMRPDELLRKCMQIMNDNGLLIITVPNDFSSIQQELMRREKINTEYWISPPDHLNYFNLRNLKEFQSNLGFEVLDSICDFPIEWFLMNESSNYVMNPEKGKDAHISRVLLESMINTHQDKNLILNFWRNLANLGFGRTITTFSKKI